MSPASPARCAESAWVDGQPTSIGLSVIFQILFLPVVSAYRLTACFHSGAGRGALRGFLPLAATHSLAFREGDRTEPSSSAKKRP